MDGLANSPGGGGYTAHHPGMRYRKFPPNRIVQERRGPHYRARESQWYAGLVYPLCGSLSHNGNQLLHEPGCEYGRFGQYRALWPITRIQRLDAPRDKRQNHGPIMAGYLRYKRLDATQLF